MMVIIVILTLLAFGLINASLKGISLTPSEKQTCKDLDISKIDCEKVVQERAQQEAQNKLATMPQQLDNATNTTNRDLLSANESLYLNGHTTAGNDYSGFLDSQADTGFNGAPHSMNYSHVFSMKQNDIHGPFAQGYYGFFGMNDNYTKTHDISGIRMHQYQTSDGALFDKESIIFANGTEVIIPAQNIGFYHGQLLP
jgi:hypothetical protein